MSDGVSNKDLHTRYTYLPVKGAIQHGNSDF